MLKWVNRTQAPRNPDTEAMAYDVVGALMGAESMDNCHVNQAGGCQCSL